MTDYPRFQWIDGDPSGSHRHYHGAPVVNLVLRIADWWLDLSRKHKREKQRTPTKTDQHARANDSPPHRIPIDAALQ